MVYRRLKYLSSLSLSLAAMALLTSTPVMAAASVSPATVSITRGAAASIVVNYSFSGISAPDLASINGDFLVRGQSIGTFASSLIVPLTSGAGSTSETVLVPAATIEAAVRLNSDRITYQRVFTNVSSGVNFAVDMVLLVAGSGPAGPLSLERAELFFVENKLRRSEVSVERNATGLKAHAELALSGSGYVSGYWEVDGRRIENFRKYTSFGTKLTIATSDVPGLPTFITGLHTVRLVIDEPTTQFALPEIVYFVIGIESSRQVDLNLNSPAKGSTLQPETIFSWQGGSQGTVYIVTITRVYDDQVVLRGLTRSLAYSIPPGLFTLRVTPRNDYRWQVEAFNAQGESIGRSEFGEVRAP